MPLAQMAEHMRVSLIDPKWKEQREIMLAKIRETTQAHPLIMEFFWNHFTENLSSKKVGFNRM